MSNTLAASSTAACSSGGIVTCQLNDGDQIECNLYKIHDDIKTMFSYYLLKQCITKDLECL